MARRGVWQLQRLVFNYCEHSGSSRGARCGPGMLPGLPALLPARTIGCSMQRRGSCRPGTAGRLHQHLPAAPPPQRCAPPPAPQGVCGAGVAAVPGR